MFHVDVTITDGRLVITALDGARVASGSIDAKHGNLDEPVLFMIPADALKKIVSPLLKDVARKGLHNTAVSVRLFSVGDAGRAWFTTDLGGVSIATFNGDRVAYAHLLDDTFSVSAIVSKRSLLSALNTVTAVNGRGRNKLRDVDINISDGGVIVSSASDAPVATSLAVKTTSTRGEVLVHSRRIDWITQMIKRGGDSVELQTNEDRTLLRINKLRELGGDHNRLTYYLAI